MTQNSGGVREESSVPVTSLGSLRVEKGVADPRLFLVKPRLQRGYTLREKVD